MSMTMKNTKDINLVKVDNVIRGINKDCKKAFKDHYNPCYILSKKCSYNMVISRRSDGKTFAMRLLIYYAWQKYGYTSVILRRLAEMIKAKYVRNDFTKIFELFPEINFKKYDGMNYFNGTIRGYWERDNNVKEYDKPFVEYLSLSNQETSKSSKDYNNLFMILFDEFLSRDKYLGGSSGDSEYMAFMNICSTCLREQYDATIVMLGNPVSWDCPYFREFGIGDVLKIPDGTIKVFKTDKSQTSIALEKTGVENGNKKIELVNSRFFGFQNNRIKSITNGLWETPLYPRLKKQFNEKVITDKLFIKCDNINLRMIICHTDKLGLFIRVHQTSIDEYEKDDVVFDISNDMIIGSNVYTKSNSNNRIKRIEQIIFLLYQQNKFFYSDNTVGETVRLFMIDYSNTQPRQFN